MRLCGTGISIDKPVDLRRLIRSVSENNLKQRKNRIENISEGNSERIIVRYAPCIFGLFVFIFVKYRLTLGVALDKVFCVNLSVTVTAVGDFIKP